MLLYINMKTNNIFFKKNNEGFTLIELLVVIAIVMIIGSIGFFTNYRVYLLKNSLAIDSESIATDIREMQNRTTNFIQDTNINNLGYGVFFDLNNKEQIETFYKTSSAPFSISELSSSNNARPIQNFILSRNNYINRICINDCLTKIVGQNGKVALYFLSPKPYAYFSFSNNGTVYNTDISGNAISHVCIEIASSLVSDLRRIDIYYIGQINFSLGGC